MHLLIIKRGALGDVVRTSYFAATLKQKHGKSSRISWVTSPGAMDLLRFNPHVDDIWTSFDPARKYEFDHVYSLDDEIDALEAAAQLNSRSISGAYLYGGKPTYTDNSALWFDMGLISRFGKQQADRLKKMNTKSHASIFAKIFDVEKVVPRFYGDPVLEKWALEAMPKANYIGLNPYSGGRWPSKELLASELDDLIESLLCSSSPFGNESRFVLLGAGPDYQRNCKLASFKNYDRVEVANTDDSVLRLSAVIKRLSYLISSDSLALHLAISQSVPFTAFFSPTSAAEIDTWGIGTKITSTTEDYCSYRSNADNRTITAERIISAIQVNLSELKSYRF